ncbi:hypothetical protein [Cystobacter fuscus]|uniref:hypothetical protein n=1 Tax=Cystobacter fuscus TaxID=43 RepID=UPI0037C10FE3
MLLPLLGCGGGNSKLTMLLKDAPGDFKAAVVSPNQERRGESVAPEAVDRNEPKKEQMSDEAGSGAFR